MAGRVAIVTGASRGIGLAVCHRLAAAGDAVGLLARDADALDAAASALRTAGAPAVAVAAADVADADATTAAIASLERELGPCEVLVNDAGAGAWGAVVDTDAATFRRMVEVNYLGTVHATAAVLAGMVDRGRGRIVNVASIAGRIGAPFEAAYSASKFAVVGYSEALAVELTGTGVTVSLVDPGPVDTDFFARRGHRYELRAPRPIGAERVAAAVMRAVDHGTAEQFVPRWLRGANAVSTVVPGLYRRGVRATFRAQLRHAREQRTLDKPRRIGHGDRHMTDSGDD